MVERFNRERNRRAQDPQAGFTLIVLLVVIIILGILAAVVVFAVGGINDRGEVASYRIDERTIRTAQEAYYSKNKMYGSEQQLVDAGLLGELSSIHDIVLSPDSQSFVTPFQPRAGVAGGTLVVGESFTFPTNSSAANALTWNPASDTSGSTHAYWEIMYNGLLTLDERGNPQAELATRVPTVANGDIFNNGKDYRLHLRNDVYWHDDNPSGTRRQFTSADVVYTFEKVLLRNHARTKNMGPFLRPAYDSAGGLATAIAPCIPAELDPGEDPNFCVAFHFTNPYAPFLKQLNVTEAPMNPKHVFCSGSCTGTTPTLAQQVTNTVGTGPFKCFNPAGVPPCRDGTDAKVIKNAAYWRTGFPYLDTIVMRPMNLDANTRTDSLITGSSDWLWDVLETRAAEVKAKSFLRTAPTQSLGGGPNSIDQLIFNLWDQGATATTINNNTAAPNPILGQTDLIDSDGPGPGTTFEPRGRVVRRAFSHAVNRPAYLASRGDVGTVATAPISSELPSHANDITLPNYDLTKTATLLDAAGWKDESGAFRVWRGPTTTGLTNGQNLDVTFVCGSGPLCTRVDTVKSQLLLAKINVVKVDCSSAATCGASSANVRIFTNRDFDLYILNLAQGYDPHIGVRRQYHSSQITDASGTATAAVPNNAAGYKDVDVDNDFDTAVTSLDPATRNALYHDFQVRVARDLPYVWVIETPNVRAFTDKCSGFRAYTGLFAEFASCRR